MEKGEEGEKEFHAAMSGNPRTRRSKPTTAVAVVALLREAEDIVSKAAEEFGVHGVTKESALLAAYPQTATESSTQNCR